MSYMRHPIYVWSDEQQTHIWPCEQAEWYADYVKSCRFPAGVMLPHGAFDALCLMRAAEIAESKAADRYARLLLKKYGGNYGSGALYRRLGQTPPWQEER